MAHHLVPSVIMTSKQINRPLVACSKAKELWLNIEEWLLNRFNLPLTFDRNAILFGKYKKCGTYMSRVYNLITLTIKYYIFSTKYKNNSYLSLSAIQQIITDRILIENFLLLKNCRYKEYQTLWKTVCEKI